MTKKQTDETAKFCLDISKISLGSLVFGFFGSDKNVFIQIINVLIGLTIAWAFYRLGMKLFKDIS